MNHPSGGLFNGAAELLPWYCRIAIIAAKLHVGPIAQCVSCLARSLCLFGNSVLLFFEDLCVVNLNFKGMCSTYLYRI